MSEEPDNKPDTTVLVIGTLAALQTGNSIAVSFHSTTRFRALKNQSQRKLFDAAMLILEDEAEDAYPSEVDDDK